MQVQDYTMSSRRNKAGMIARKDKSTVFLRSTKYCDIIGMSVSMTSDLGGILLDDRAVCINGNVASGRLRSLHLR
jgi:hypothetical protein